MPNTTNRLKWGIVGLGNIAHQFVQDLQLVNDIEIVACASRSKSNALSFAQKHHIPKAYDSYTDLFADPEVEIVYIATTHNTHAELSITAMQNGKHVLCEKPLAVNRTEVGKIVEASRKYNVFIMEAFWSKFNPSIQAVLRHIENKDIGEVNYVNADFTFYRNDPDDSRMLDINLAGGSLLDMGVYPVFLAYEIFGKPEQILATSRLHTTGADIQTAAIFKYKNGIANMMSGFKSQSDMVAKIYGTEGRIYINSIWHETQGYTLVKGNDGSFDQQDFHLPTKGKGFTYEIEECKKCIAQGKNESELWSHQNSLDLIEITDEIRRQVGVRYPFEGLF